MTVTALAVFFLRIRVAKWFIEIVIFGVLAYGLLCELGIGCILSIIFFVIHEGILLFT